jgi:hypothetical protein
MKIKVYIEHIQGVEYEVDTEDSAVIAAYNEQFGEADEELEPGDIQDLLNEVHQEESLAVLHRLATRVGVTSGEYVRCFQAVAK